MQETKVIGLLRGFNRDIFLFTVILYYKNPPCYYYQKKLVNHFEYYSFARRMDYEAFQMPFKDMHDRQKSSNDQSRIKLTAGQVNLLNDVYRSNSRPNYVERHLLAVKLGIADDKIKNWFQNKRAKNRKDATKSPSSGYSSTETASVLRPNVYPNCSDLYKKRRF